VTPNLNMGKYLAQTIESVIENLSPGDQYFIVDGGSNDGSLEIIQKYRDHITGWISEPDKGYADAISKGFRNSDSTFQCWINSGDLLLPGAIKTARQVLSQTAVEMIFGDDLYIDEEDGLIQVSNGYVANLANAMLYGGWTPLQDACFWRSSLYSRINGINSDLHYAADFDLFLRMSLESPPLYVSKVFSAFRKHSGQKSIRYSRGYAKERDLSRKKLMLANPTIKPILNFVLTFYYWVLVRYRARINGSKKSMKNFLETHTDICFKGK